MYDFDMTPQHRVENLSGELERIMASTHRHARIEPLDESSWLPFVTSHRSSVANTYGNDMLLEDDQRSPPFTWLQEGDRVVVTLQLSQSDVSVTAEGIDSSALRGRWWGAVSDVEAFDVGGITQITLSTAAGEHWPYLVIGGSPDAASCYFLGLVALELKQFEFAEMWLARSSCLECHSALTSYVMTLYDQGRYAESCHWAARCVLRFHDQLCGFVLAKCLLEGRGVAQSPGIAEFMLCRLVLQGFPDAFCELGRLYLNGAEGVEPMVEKAKYLLTLAAFQYGDGAAKELLEVADFSPSKREEESTEKEGKKEEEKKKKEDEEQPGVVDWVITSGIVAAAAVAGYALFRRFFRRK